MTSPADTRSPLVRRATAAVRLAFSAAPVTTTLLIGLSVVEGLLPVVVAWCLKLLLDELSRGGDAALTTVAAATAGLAGAGLLMSMRQSVDTYLSSMVRRAVQLTVQDRLLKRVNGYVGLRRFENPRFLNQLQLAEDAGERVPQELVNAAVVLVRTGLTSIGLLVILFVIWPPIAAVLVAAAVPTVLGQMSLSRRRAGLTENMTPLIRRRAFFNALLTDTRAAKEVRLFGLGAWLHERILGDLRMAHRAEAAVDRRTLRVEAALDLVGAAVTVAGTVAAAYQAVHGRLTIGDVSVFLTAIGAVHVALGGAATAGALTYQGLLLFGHYQDIVEEAPVDGRPEGRAVPATVAPLRQGIELRDVWFRYHDDAPWVLRGVSLTIPAGATVALIGRNGAGKSTIVKLLCRMYDPDSGVICWDGTDLKELDPAGLRARVGAVFQDFMEYDLTAAENIGVGRLSALDDLDAIRAAARAAGIDATLAALPAGYGTLLSRMFLPDDEDEAAQSLLSGGQWQRVALARAFLRGEADLMILDEPSSGLDAEAEHEIHRTLTALRAGRTSLLTSHRLSTLRDADMSYVIDEGQVVERGRHAELLAAGGTYAHLFELQAAGYRSESEG